MESKESSSQSVKSLIFINQLIIKAMESETLKKIHFLILNETKYILSYDIALICEVKSEGVEIAGISGLVDVDRESETIRDWEILVKNIPNKKSPCLLDGSMFSNCLNEWDNVNSSRLSHYYWLPINSQDSLLMGLIAVFPNESYNASRVAKEVDIFMNFLMPGYAVALERHKKRLIDIGGGKKKIGFLAGILFLLLFGYFFTIPLRIVSSCEVVSAEPVIVVAPLEGVIKTIEVIPGQEVIEGQLLVQYDKSAFLQDLKIAQKEVELREAEIERVKTLGYHDDEKLSELQVHLARNDQAYERLNFAKYQFNLLTIESPVSGTVSIDNPQEWIGRPVSIGEKILTIDTQENTKLLIWVAEGDNINLEKERTINIILNANPTEMYEARLDYVSTVSKINDQNIVSFEAEAAWLEQPNNVKIGQKGVAIMYGQPVPLLYYLFRKPLLFFRKSLGV